MGDMKEDGLNAKAEMASESKVTIEQAIKAASENVEGTMIEAEWEKARKHRVGSRGGDH